VKDLILDSMVEARAAREWEEINQEPVIDTDMAINFLGFALGDLESVFSSIGEAADSVKSSPMHYRILSLLEDLGRVRDDITSIKTRMEEGDA